MSLQEDKVRLVLLVVPVKPLCTPCTDHLLWIYTVFVIPQENKQQNQLNKYKTCKKTQNANQPTKQQKNHKAQPSRKTFIVHEKPITWPKLRKTTVNGLQLRSHCVMFTVNSFGYKLGRWIGHLSPLLYVIQIHFEPSMLHITWALFCSLFFSMAPWYLLPSSGELSSLPSILLPAKSALSTTMHGFLSPKKWSLSFQLTCHVLITMLSKGVCLWAGDLLFYEYTRSQDIFQDVI